MGLKSMHEASRQSLPEPKQSNEQENSLLEQQSQRITELEHQISELSSINSTLMNELQKKSEIIVKLNEKEEIYNKSDLIKKQNAELEKQNRELEKARQRAEAEAMTEVETVKKEYAERERELARTQAEANKAKIDAEDTRSHQKELVNEKAQQMYNSRRKSLESAYQGKRIALDGVFFGSLAYGVLCTRIIYNEKIAIAGIPEEAYNYVVNGKSAIEWIMERYAVTTDKASGIVNDPNDWALEHNDPKYIFNLVLRIITVSLETMKIVKNLPKLKF